VKHGVLHHAVEIPLVTNLVAGLVVVQVGIAIDLLFAPARWPADDIGAAVEVSGWHADTREAELVRAIERATIGELVWHHHAALQRSHFLYHQIEVGFAVAYVGEVARATPYAGAVHVKIGGNK